MTAKEYLAKSIYMDKQDRQDRQDGWCGLKRRVQEILARHVLHAATLAGLDVLLGSCFRRKDGCWFFAQSLPQE